MQAKVSRGLSKKLFSSSKMHHILKNEASPGATSILNKKL